MVKVSIVKAQMVVSAVTHAKYDMMVLGWEFTHRANVSLIKNTLLKHGTSKGELAEAHQLCVISISILLFQSESTKKNL